MLIIQNSSFPCKRRAVFCLYFGCFLLVFQYVRKKTIQYSLPGFPARTRGRRRSPERNCIKWKSPLSPTTYLISGSSCPFALRCRFIHQDIPRLAVERPTNGFQSGKPHGFGFSVFQYGKMDMVTPTRLLSSVMLIFRRATITSKSTRIMLPAPFTPSDRFLPEVLRHDEAAGSYPMPASPRQTQPWKTIVFR